MSTQIRGAQIKDLFAGDGLDWVSTSGTNRNYLAVQVDDSSLEISGDALQVKALGITDAMLAGSISDGNLAEDYIMTSEVDDSTIEFDSGTLNIKAAGVTETELNASVAGAGLAGGGGTPLSVNVKEGIEIDSDFLRISAYAAGNGLAGGAGSALSVNTASGIGIVGDNVVLLDTTAGAGLTYTAGVLNVIGGNGITANADDVEVDFKVNDGLEFDGIELTVDYDNSTIGIVSNDLAVKDAGITGTQLNTSVAGDGLAGGGGSALSVNVDGTTITIVTDTLQANASALDHGVLLGLDGDDHTQYSLADGTRDFTGIVQYDAHKNFTADTDIVDKKYVDDNTTATGVIDHGGLLGLDDNDHTQYLMTGTAPLAVTGQDVALTILAADLAVDGSSQLYVVDGGIDHNATDNYVADEHVAHSTVSISGGGLLTGGGNIDASRVITLVNSSIDHGSIGGLAGDDHTQYSLVDGTRAFSGVVGGITPTATAHLTTKGYVDALVQGLDWQDSVISMATEYGDAAASGTNRYIAPSTSGTWTDDYIYEWNGSSWTETVPNEGNAAWIEDEDVLKVYNGSAWVTFGSTISHNNLTGLQGGTGGEYYHLTNSDFTDLVTNQRETIEDYVGAMTSGTQTNIAVTYSDNGGGHGDLNYVVDTATTSGLGVASFVAADFDVAGGAVSLEDTVLKSITTDTSVMTMAAHAISILGSDAQGIDVTHVGTVITIAGEDASTSNKGVASFDTNHFSVTTGAVSLVANGIDETLIDWGSGGDQVDATSVPIDAGGSWAGSASNVQDALEELESESTTEAFKTVVVAGQDDVVADAKDDTLTFIAGTDITITTNSGTDAVTIASAGSSTLTASSGVERVVNDFRADLLAAGGLKLTGNEIGVEPNDFAGAGLEDDGSDNLRLAATVAGSGMTHSAGVLNVIGGTGMTANADDIAVNYDDSTIGISGDNLYVKDEGVTEGKLDIHNAPTISGVLGYTSNGMEWIDIDTEIDAVTESDIRLENESSSCNGATTAFTLDLTPVDNSLQVFLNGLIQEKGSGKDYTHTGTTVTFVVAPLAGDILLIHYIAKD